MPKKKKSDEEDSKEKRGEKNDSELEELIDEEKLKEITQDIEEETVSSKTNIDEDQFREFLQTELASPVLEEIAGEQELNTKFFSTSGTGRNFEEDDKAFRYDAQAQEDEPKYQGNYSSVGQNLERVDITKVGKDITNPQVRKAEFVSSTNLNNDSPMQEKYQEAKRIDMEEIRKKNPFETNLQEVERKYEVK